MTDADIIIWFARRTYNYVKIDSVLAVFIDSYYRLEHLCQLGLLKKRVVCGDVYYLLSRHARYQI